MISNKVRGTTVIVAVTISVFLMLLGFASAGFAATVTSVTPSLGNPSGGTSVTIVGTGFGATQGAGGVTIDGVPATITLWGNTSITCLTPGPHPASPPPVDVVVTPNVGAIATVFGGFTYGVITVTSVAPALGPTAGNISVTITGTNFGAPTSTVRFGTTPAASYTSRTDTQIVCITPAHAASIVDVTVTRGDSGGSATLAGSFTFANVTIASIDTGVLLTPTSSPTNSGIVQATITGTNFGPLLPLSTVTFGTTPATILTWVPGFPPGNPDVITCLVPNHTAGPVNVVVRRGDGGGFGTLSGVFSYFDVTVASVLTPNLQPIPPTDVNFGPVVGGTPVTITGTHFGIIPIPASLATAVQFSDGINPPAFAVGPWTWTDTQITCFTPASPILPFPFTGMVNVTVVRDDFGFGRMTAGWAYGGVTVISVNPPAPARGTIAGGTVVSINGTPGSFGAARGLLGGVTFGGVPVNFGLPGTSWSDTLIVCTTPAHAVGPVDVRVTNNTGIFGTLVGGFTYFEVTVDPLTIASPNFGSTAGGTVVTITGTNFGTIQGGVQFGGTSADFSIPGSTWADTSITCTAPAHGAGRVDVVVTRSDGGFGTRPALPFGFNYIGVGFTPPLVPAGGTTAGGTRVIINGTSFGTTLGTVTLGGVPMFILPTSWSDTQIVGTTGAHPAPGLVDVIVTRTDGVPGTLANGYTYFNVTITTFTPVTGPITGNTSVTITGTNFLSFGATQGTVRFDGTPATIVSWADTSITCRTPAHAAGPVNFVVTRVDPSYSPLIASAPTGVFYYGVTINALAPIEGPVGGGTVVTINGANFGATQGSGTVMFGGAPATIAAPGDWTDTQITCTTTAHLAGPVDVVVTRDGGIIGTSLASGYPATGFFYGVLINTVTVPPAPVGTLAVGPVGGGTIVEIVGDNFGPFQGTGSVTFGGAAADFAFFGANWSNNLIICRTQAHTVPGLFDVVVTKDGLPPFISGTLQNSFYYGVTVTSVSPTFGPITGGTPVTIVGANFGPAPSGLTPANVRFGGIVGTITAWTNTSITCRTPAHVAGAVDVVVTRNDGINGVLVNGFFYGVGITSVTPNVGPVGGGITVTITGTNFGAAQGALGSVKFDGIPATGYIWTDTQIVCTTPAHVAGAVNVVVTRSDGVVAGTAPNGFFYGVVITSVVPNVTPVGGGLVDIYGQNFDPPTLPGTHSVTFGGILATGVTWISDTHINCFAPAHLVAGNPVPGAVDVVVTRNDGLSGTLPGHPSPPGFYYGVTVTSITPNVGPIAGGTVVTILGDNFGTSPGPGGGVTFLGPFPATDYVWTNTSITCVVPAFPFPIPPLLLPGFTVQSDVVVTRNDGVNGVLVNGFTYGVGITSVTPALGPTGIPNAADTVTVTIAGSPFGDFATEGAGTVTFGGIPTTTVFNATNWTNTQIVCKTPPHVAGPVSVVVTRHDSAADGVLPNGFFYGIVINTVTPNVGSEVPPLTTPVFIDGDNFGLFQGTGSVTFGGTPAVILPGGWGNNTIGCTAPAHTAGPVDIVVTRDGGISATMVNGFTYGVTINTVAPTGGPVAGGTIVTISGANFGITQGTVVFGGLLDPIAAITSWSDTQIVCVTPPRILGPGAVDVRVTRIDGTFGIKPLSFFYGIVTVASVTPALGPVAGGTPVTIVGTNFGIAMGTGGVTFGGLAAPIISGGWTDTQIQCLTPAHAAGAFDVVVTRTGGVVSDILPHKVFIYGVVTVASVTPVLGPLAGNTSVTISGTNFGDTQGAVTFGGAAATIIPANWTNTQIVCTTSAHLAGLVDVVVARADDVVTAGIHSGQGALASGFLYGAVTITSVTPALGPVAGGTPVTIAGTNFGATAGTVTFDGIAATDIVWGATITCKTPGPHAAGAVNVVVTRADDVVTAGIHSGQGTLPSGFTYGVVTVASVTPNVGPTGGSTSVAIAGTNFGATAGTVTFDGIAATDIVWGATITCKTPGPHAVGAVPVVVTRGDGGGSGTLASGFTYQQQFVVVSPTAPVPANVNVNFSVEVWINGITSAKLFYKKGGEASYSAPITLNPTGAPWTWSNNIPAIDVTARGLLYYVEVNGATHAFYPGGASVPAIPANISVHAPSSFAFYTTPPAHSNVYNLIAPNGRPDDDNLRTVVGPVFNEGGGGTWIAWGYNPSAGIFVRLPNTAGTFIPGQSWFFAKDGSGMPQAVPFSSTSVDASVAFEITLQPGWNLVANPFAFPVAWSDTGIEIRDSAGTPYTPTQANIGSVVSDKLHWLNPATGSYIKRVSSEDPPFTMMPNQGEWLFSGVAGAKMLIKPIFHTPTAVESPAAPKKDMTAWEVTLSLQSSTGSDSVTASVGKSTGKVELNQIKSPGMPLAPYIALTRDDQVGAASMLSSDVKAISDELTWSIKATASSEVSLDWSLVNVPDDYMLSLEDQAGKVVNLRQDSAIHLGVGVYDFILKAEKKVLIPKTTKLLANYPNPFNPETWIPYELSKDTDVAIKIYASNGQLVRSLELGHKMAGFYNGKDKAAYWDGKNEVGEQVSSGIYFYNIQAGDYKDIRKMVIVK